MPTLADLATPTVPWPVEGRIYRLHPLTLADLGSIELQVLSQEQEKGDEGNSAPRAESAAAAARAIPSWVESFSGTAYVLWLSLRTYQPDILLDQAESLVEQLACVATPLPNLPSADDDGNAGRWDLSSLSPRLFDYFACRYGWTPCQIAMLTLAQVGMLLGAHEPCPGRAWLTRSQYQQLRRGLAGAPAAKAPVGACLPPHDAELHQRLAGFRCQLPRVYAPLTRASLEKLAVAVARIGDGHRSERESIRPTQPTAIAGRTFDAMHVPAELVATLRRVDALVDALRRVAGENRASGASDSRGMARFQ